MAIGQTDVFINNDNVVFKSPVSINGKLIVGDNGNIINQSSIILYDSLINESDKPLFEKSSYGTIANTPVEFYVVDPISGEVVNTILKTQKWVQNIGEVIFSQDNLQHIKNRSLIIFDTIKISPFRIVFCSPLIYSNSILILDSDD